MKPPALTVDPTPHVATFRNRQTQRPIRRRLEVRFPPSPPGRCPDARPVPAFELSAVQPEGADGHTQLSPLSIRVDPPNAPQYHWREQGSTPRDDLQRRLLGHRTRRSEGGCEDVRQPRAPNVRGQHPLTRVGTDPDTTRPPSTARPPRCPPRPGVPGSLRTRSTIATFSARSLTRNPVERRRCL